MPSMKNRRVWRGVRRVGRDGRWHGGSQKSPEALDWQRSAIPQINRARAFWSKDPWAGQWPYTGEAEALVHIWYRSGRSDVDPALLFDTLQKAGVIKSDNQIRRYTVDGIETDAKRPRVLVYLFPLRRQGVSVLPEEYTLKTMCNILNGIIQEANSEREYDVDDLAGALWNMLEAHKKGSAPDPAAP